MTRAGQRGVTATAHARTRASAQQAYDFSGPLDPAQFYPRFGPLPAVVTVLEQSGTWDAVGHTRRLVLSDGGHVIETITDAAAPELFAYELSEFQKLFGLLVSGARAEWRFDDRTTGSRIRWSYTFFAKPARGWIVWLIIRLWWGRYMRRVLPPIAREVERLAAN
ncbi:MULTISPECIES: SRPBCC family protein [unclassified Salinibacterium]|uniref:SRPBCC family protein n=1 Tax=unclassified Salinibacterium TaxID=2632331 RepID=UPI0018CFCE03|nr:MULTISPECIES: SRPBCC family protein [unclassified Salinibacterium]MBH0053828.1 SRPBCC family protein [Salinibacterium sp. SWN139]MBH0083089.1 SRPBCC family protein [Salinibacterium sp. SWN167]MBH0115868.1 SRPBCC family protein [Salinibacterium sp. NG253]